MPVVTRAFEFAQSCDCSTTPPAAEVDASTDGDALGDACPICQDSIIDGESIVLRLSCNHSFHQTCIVEHFRRNDGRCPLCRDNPFEESWSDDGFDEEVDDTPLPICLSGALQLAKEDKTTPVVQKMKKTIKKWKKTKREAHKKYREVATALANAEDREVFDKVNAYQDELYNSFRRKHAADFEKQKELNDLLNAACRNKQQAEMRLGKRFGYRRMRYSRRRWRSRRRA